jgi:hypothetical protein
LLYSAGKSLRLPINPSLLLRHSSGVFEVGGGIVGTLLPGGGAWNEDCPGEPKSGRGAIPLAGSTFEDDPDALPIADVDGVGLANTGGFAVELMLPSDAPLPAVPIPVKLFPAAGDCRLEPPIGETARPAKSGELAFKSEVGFD